ncbi:glycerophosphodiester phosphodiesterase [Gilvimarinus sp. F26214L]|uniref:glycerophosphodiester phosphodiesterase n=1 Tax=Gilvimarinus sp. DZF01 TaxID=3461371 RepID=UPI0040458C0D
MGSGERRLLSIAHRGGRAHGTENTLTTIENALSMGVDGIEIDVWQIGHQLLVTHDRQLGRVIRGQGRLMDLEEEDLPGLRNYDDSPVPSLMDVLDVVGDRALLNVELKGPNCAPLVANQVREHCRSAGVPAEHYIISSFDHPQLFWMKENAPEFRRGVLLGTIPLDYAACCDPLDAWSLHPSIDFVNEALVQDARRRGLEVWVYTVNDLDDMRDLHAMGVTGVFADFPERVLNFNREELGLDR